MLYVTVMINGQSHFHVLSYFGGSCRYYSNGNSQTNAVDFYTQAIVN